MIFEGTKNQFFFGLELTRAGISFPDIELMEELAQVFQVDVADIIRGEEAGRAEHTVNELVKDTI